MSVFQRQQTIVQISRLVVENVNLRSIYDILLAHSFRIICLFVVFHSFMTTTYIDPQPQSPVQSDLPILMHTINQTANT